MTDHTLHDMRFDPPGFRPTGSRPHGGEAGHEGLTGPGTLRMLMDDFRAVPAEAWIILAVATVMSNLFIALA